MSAQLASVQSTHNLGNKRLLEEHDENSFLPLSELSFSKRARQQPTASSGRCSPNAQAYTVGHSTFTALRALFADMSDKVIADVLAEYGNNIDAAIKHLNSLRLSGVRANQCDNAAISEPEQSEQQQHRSAEQAQTATPVPASSLSVQDRSASEWVDLVVQQMAEASSVEDAKQRAASILQAFEQAAVRHSEKQGGPEGERSKLQVQELLKENQLLKRAVAIQNSRMQELGHKEQQLQQLRQLVEGYQQKVQALETQNYSLALHLKQATDGVDPFRSHKNPDVF